MKNKTKKTNAKASHSKSLSSSLAHPLKSLSNSKRGRSAAKVLGIEAGTFATVLGVAAVGAAGYLIWQNREKLMTTFGKLKDGTTESFNNMFGKSDDMNARSGSYSSDASDDSTSRI